MVKDWLEFIVFLVMLIRVKFGIVQKVKEFQEEMESFLCSYLLDVWCHSDFSCGEVHSILRFLYNTLENEKSS